MGTELTKDIDDTPLADLQKEVVGLEDDLVEILYQLENGLYNIPENPESKVWLEKQFIEKTDRKEAVDNTILYITNSVEYINASPTKDTGKWTVNMLKEAK